jgi:hypothetical protein
MLKQLYIFFKVYHFDKKRDAKFDCCQNVKIHLLFKLLILGFLIYLKAF